MALLLYGCDGDDSSGHADAESDTETEKLIPCTSTEVAYSDRSDIDAIGGNVGDVVAVTCLEGYAGGGDWVCGDDATFSGTPCTCKMGFQDNDNDGTCSEDCNTASLVCGAEMACDDSTGIASCACLAGLQDHDNNGTCLTTCDVSGLTCIKGTCDDSGGVAGCVCDTGWTGTNCDSCATGYQDHDSNNTCSPDCATENPSCGANATCSDNTGTALCTCEAGLQDHDGDGDCLVGCSIINLACGTNAACDDSSGTAACACEAGFQDHDGNGDCSEDCGTANPACGANSVCDDASGTAACECEVGFQDHDEDGLCAPSCQSDPCTTTGEVCFDHSGVVECVLIHGEDCLAILGEDPMATDGTYTIHPVGSTRASEVWCDMTTDGGGYTLYKVALADAAYAPAAEALCAERGMQLFIPRNEDHLTTAHAVALDDTFGPTGQWEYLSIMGIYPDMATARCRYQAFTSSNTNCLWSASDGGSFWVSERTDISEPNGDNSMGQSMGYTFDTSSPAVSTYNDLTSGASSRYFMCDTGTKQ